MLPLYGSLHTHDMWIPWWRAAAVVRGRCSGWILHKGARSLPWIASAIREFYRVTTTVSLQTPSMVGRIVMKPLSEHIQSWAMASWRQIRFSCPGMLSPSLFHTRQWGPFAEGTNTIDFGDGLATLNLGHPFAQLQCPLT